MRNLSILIVVFMMACKTTQKTSMYDYGSCPFKSTNWMSISDSLNRKSELNINASVSLFLKSLKDLIAKGDTSALPLLRAAISKSNQEFSMSKAQVSQSFYEAHLDRSMQLCGIWNYIRKNKFDSPEEKAKYQQVLDKLIIGVEAENKRLNPIAISQNNYGTGTQINNNFINPNIFLHEEDTIDAGTNVELKFITENRIQVNPKVGSWSNPYVAVKYDEKDCLAGFKNSSGAMIAYRRGEVPADNSSFGFSFESPITKAAPAFIELRCKPSLIYFGDKSNAKSHFVYNLK